MLRPPTSTTARGFALLTVEQLEPRQVLSVSFQSWGSTSGGIDVSLGDLDGDGDLDAFVTSGSANSMINGKPNRVWLNDGSGTFTDSGQTLGNSFSNKVALGDVDGDGDLDAWVANGVSRGTGGEAAGLPDVFTQPNRVWLNDGSGTFTDSGQTLGGALSTSVALGDVDGDGDLDALVGNSGISGGSPRNRLWLNDGTGTFTDSGQALGNSESRGVALGDLDGDGDLDALVVNGSSFNSHPNRVWLNDGSGSFSRSRQVLRSPSSNSVALGDLDGDGDLDAWVANGILNGAPNQVWLNDGTGTFIDRRQALGNSDTRDVVLGDLDGDGDLDALVANGLSSRSRDPANRVWLNDGSGTFTDSGQALGGNSRSVALGDLDGDGDLDAWVPGEVWLNRSGEFAAGDANRDFQFDQQDIVQVLQAAKYLTGVPATFEEGDWNGDGVFDQLDIVDALQTGNYLQGP